MRWRSRNRESATRARSRRPRPSNRAAPRARRAADRATRAVRATRSWRARRGPQVERADEVLAQPLGIVVVELPARAVDVEDVDRDVAHGVDAGVRDLAAIVRDAAAELAQQTDLVLGVHVDDGV